MKQKRVVGVDILRAISILWIMIYHFWVLSGQAAINCAIIKEFIQLGGEIGVTLFFLLSGFGIYYTLKNAEDKGTIRFLPFFQRRCLRILPGYYVNIILVTILGSGVYLFYFSNLGDYFLHFLLLHNLSPRYSGSINGVLWTMAITVQFYYISIILYKLLKKNYIYFLVLTIFETVVAKFVGYIILYQFLKKPELAFFAGRSFFILTVLDNFTIGMFVAYCIEEKGLKIKKIIQIVMIILSFIFLYLLCTSGYKYGIHTNNWSGYTWHSILAIVLGILLLAAASIEYNEKNVIVKIMKWIAKYQYEIYLWHLVVAEHWLQNSQILQRMQNEGKYVAIFVFLIGITIFTGYLMTKMVDEGLMEVYRRKRER